jgi:predicted ATPase
MIGKNLPMIVAESLASIAVKISEFNQNLSESKLEVTKLVSKHSKEYLLKVYPKKFETLYFTIVRYYYRERKIDDFGKKDILYYEYEINNDSLISMRSKNYLFFASVKNNGVSTQENLKQFIESYFNTIQELIIEKEGLESSNLELSDLFELELEIPELNPIEDVYASRDKILPICIKQLSVENFQGIDTLKIEHISVDSQWLFLVGENGFGKTTILQSIFLGLNGTSDGNINLLDSKNAVIQLEYKSNEVSHINNAIENNNPLIHIAAYGPGRLNLQGAASENAEDRNSSVSYNLFKSDGFLFNINAELVKWALKKDKRFDLVKKAFCTLIPNLADIRFNKETDQIEYIEKEIGTTNDTKATYQPLPFQKLASGFKSIIALAGDIIVRLSKNQKEAKDPSDLAGIVLIDEIDLHLHPKFQKKLIGSFSKVFPKIQFIVSTHSPIPLLGAPENSMIFKVTRNKADGVQIEEVKIDLKNLTPNLVLTSGIFDMEDFVSVQNEDITQVRTEDSFDEMKHNDEVEKYLKDFEKSDKNFPDELFLSKSK